MTRVTVIKQSRYPLADRGLALVVGTRLAYATAAGPVPARVVAVRREPAAGARAYRLTLEVPASAVPSRQDPPVCPVCGGPARREPAGDGVGVRCVGPCV